MASVNKLDLDAQNHTSAGALAFNGSAQSIGALYKSLIGFCKISSYSAGTLTCKIQHSCDAVNWVDLISFAAKSSNTFEIAYPTLDKCLGYVRATVTAPGATNANVLVQLWFDK